MSIQDTVHLSQDENKLFSIADEHIRYSNLSKEEWIAMRSLVDDRSIVIKGPAQLYGIEMTI